jgi:hypothetical protein
MIDLLRRVRSLRPVFFIARGRKKKGYKSNKTVQWKKLLGVPGVIGAPIQKASRPRPLRTGSMSCRAVTLVPLCELADRRRGISAGYDCGYGGLGQTELARDTAERTSRRTQRAHFRAIANYTRSSEFRAVPPGAFKTGNCSFTQSDTLLLGDRREDRQHGIPEGSARVKVFLGEAAPIHAPTVQPLKVLKCFEHAFAAEAIQRPEQDQVEHAKPRIVEQRLEFRPPCRAGTDVIDIFAYDVPALARAELAKLQELILRVLALVLRRHSTPPTRLYLQRNIWLFCDPFLERRICESDRGMSSQPNLFARQRRPYGSAPNSTTISATWTPRATC